MVRRMTAAVLLASGLAACSAATPDWVKPGVDAIETETAWANCQAQARQVADYGGGAIEAPPRQLTQDALEVYDREKAERTYQQTLSSCMRAKGYFPAPRGE